MAKRGDRYHSIEIGDYFSNMYSIFEKGIVCILKIATNLFFRIVTLIFVTMCQLVGSRQIEKRHTLVFIKFEEVKNLKMLMLNPLAEF